MMLPPKNTLIMGGAVMLVIAALVFWYSRRSRTREPFQTTATAPTNPSAVLAAAVTIPTAPPPDLIGNPEVCATLKKMLDVTNAQMNNDLVKSNPGQLKLIQISHDSIIKQISDLKCA